MNRANQQLEEETAKFRNDKAALELEILKLKKQVVNLEQTVRDLRDQNEKLIESNEIDLETEHLHRRLSSLTHQMEELKSSGKYIPEKSITKKDMSYINELEQRCREIQRDNQRLLDFNGVKSQSVNDYVTRDSYLNLLTSYNELIKSNRQLEGGRINRSREASRPHTQYQYHTEGEDELRNVYKQVEILNNIIMDKDFEIQSLRKITTTRLIPTPDLTLRSKSPSHLPPLAKKLGEHGLAGSNSQRQIRPISSLHASNLM